MPYQSTIFFNSGAILYVEQTLSLSLHPVANIIFPKNPLIPVVRQSSQLPSHFLSLLLALFSPKKPPLSQKDLSLML